ncbi:MAG TPA: hypothetical protein VL096_05055 [Pirellulaceae bacterium]|nr:hypothetical protein [Pirellulaceae bacterium]
MRAAYDCVVFGHGPAACLAASVIAARGFRALLVREAVSASTWSRHLLLPRAALSLPAFAALGINELQLDAAADRSLAIDYDGVQERHWLLAGARLAEMCLERGRAHGLTITESPRGCHDLAATLRIDTAPAVSAGERFDLAISGAYRQVNLATLADDTTGLVIDSPSGAQFWLVPINDELTNLGLILPDVARGRVRDTASIWEDELVSCQPLVERLLEAELVGAFVAERIPRANIELSTEPCDTIQLRECHFPVPYPMAWPSPWQALETAVAAIDRLEKSSGQPTQNTPHAELDGSFQLRKMPSLRPR